MVHPELLRKYGKLFLFVVIGGILGFTFHLIWHSILNISLFSYSSHIINGIFHTVIGIITGIFVWYLLKRK